MRPPTLATEPPEKLRHTPRALRAYLRECAHTGILSSLPAPLFFQVRPVVCVSPQPSTSEATRAQQAGALLLLMNKSLQNPKYSALPYFLKSRYERACRCLPICRRRDLQVTGAHALMAKGLGYIMVVNIARAHACIVRPLKLGHEFKRMT